MKKIIRPYGAIVIIIMLFSCVVKAQPEAVIDRIIATVGNDVILLSDLEKTYMQYSAQGVRMEEFDMKCEILEELLFQKLLKYQAVLDSVDISDQMVEGELDRRMRFFVSQIGSEEALEKYFQKSISAIKDELSENIYNQLMSETVQRKITENVHITPAEVNAFFRNIPKDSLPLVGSEVGLSHIVIIPKVTDEEKLETKQKLEKMRSEITSASDFRSKAVLYSQDPGSAKKGGDLGSVRRGELYPEVEAVAFSLAEGEISEVFESRAGYHIVQLIERRGERVNLRHILLKPTPSPYTLVATEKQLDSIATLIMSGAMTFEEAARKFSDDESKTTGGVMVNPYSGTNRFPIEQLDVGLFMVIDKLKVGEISRPVSMQTEEGKNAYRIIRLQRRTEPHTANLKDDYQMIQEAALEDKKNRIISDWIIQKTKNTYINIIDDYNACIFQNKWTN